MKGRVQSEAGYSLIELLVGAAAGTVVLFALFAIFDLSLSNSAKVTQRVDANGRAKPAMQQLMTDLHSACTGPLIAPVLPGSTATELRFQMGEGNAVSPTPAKHVVALSGDTLTEKVYPATGGANPSWTYGSSPTSQRILLEGVGAPSGGPLFSYWAAQAGVVSSMPLAVPLSTTDAARAVQVRVEMEVQPAEQDFDDPNAAVTLSDSALFRFSPFSEDPTKVNGPCA